MAWERADVAQAISVPLSPPSGASCQVENDAVPIVAGDGDTYK